MRDRLAGFGFSLYGAGERDERIPMLIALLTSGTDEQKEDAAALGNIALNADNTIWIARHNGIAPLITLVASGTDMQKQSAAGALRNLSANDENDITIARGDGIAPLIALVASGTTNEQKEHAAAALGNIAMKYNNRTAIADGNGIPPLIALVTSGTPMQKENAVRALSILSMSYASQIAIEGGIPPLIALVTSGTDGQKQYAASTLYNIADHNKNKLVSIAPLILLATSGMHYYADSAEAILQNTFTNNIVIAHDDEIAPLIALATSETNEHKERAERVLRSLAMNIENAVFIARGGIPGLRAVIRNLHLMLPTKRVAVLKTLRDVAKKNLWQFNQALDTLGISGRPFIHSMLEGNYFTQEENSAASNLLRAIMDIPTDEFELSSKRRRISD